MVFGLYFCQSHLRILTVGIIIKLSLSWQKKSVGCIEHYLGAQECTRLSNFLSRYRILSVCQLASCSSRYQATL